MGVVPLGWNCYLDISLPKTPPRESNPGDYLYVSATELTTQRSSAFANIRRAEEEAVLKNGIILTNTLDELEYTTSGTIRTIPDSAFNTKSH
jgi:hypothetical protein